MDIRFEVQRLAGIARDRHVEAEERVQRAAQDGDTYTPFMLEQVVSTQLHFALWERTRHYVGEGSEGKFVIGEDRLADTDDPKAALQALVEHVKEPTAYRGDGFPMDEAFRVLENRAYQLWREACSDLLAKAGEKQPPNGSA